METRAIYHHESLLTRAELFFKELTTTIDRSEKYRVRISAFSFCTSVIVSSLAVSFTAYIKSEILLFLTLGFSMLTTGLCVAMARLRIIVLCCIASLVISSGCLLYGIIAYWDVVKSYI